MSPSSAMLLFVSASVRKLGSCWPISFCSCLQATRVIEKKREHSLYPIVVQQERVQSRQQRQIVHFADVVVRQIDHVELVLNTSNHPVRTARANLGRAQVLDGGDLQIAEVDLPLADRIDELVRIVDSLHRQANHFFSKHTLNGIQTPSVERKDSERVRGPPKHSSLPQSTDVHTRLFLRSTGGQEGG